VNFTRRTFILGGGAIACLPGKAAPSNRIAVGVIGVGRQTVGAGPVGGTEIRDGFHRPGRLERALAARSNVRQRNDAH